MKIDKRTRIRPLAQQAEDQEKDIERVSDKHFKKRGRKKGVGERKAQQWAC